MTKPRVLILHATGTNRDRDVAWACELAGGIPEIVHINQLMTSKQRLSDYQMLVLPGGFSYGDDLGAGKLWAVALQHRLADELAAFIAAKRPVLGICNGFQALVKAGLLPGLNEKLKQTRNLVQTVTLTRNDSAQFECRWVHLQPQTQSVCIFTQGLQTLIYCPVAHGEGKFVAKNTALLNTLEQAGLVALRYVRVTTTGTSASSPAAYPWNPNGSQADIAGICNPEGTVLGLMPHPENHLIPAHHPRFHRGEVGLSGLPLFENGIRYAAGL